MSEAVVVSDWPPRRVPGLVVGTANYAGKAGRSEPARRRPDVSAQPAELPLRASSAKRGQGTYTARHLSVLEGLEAVRKRPACTSDPPTLAG